MPKYTIKSFHQHRKFCTTILISDLCNYTSSRAIRNHSCTEYCYDRWQQELEAFFLTRVTNSSAGSCSKPWSRPGCLTIRAQKRKTLCHFYHKEISIVELACAWKPRPDALYRQSESLWPSLPSPQSDLKSKNIEICKMKRRRQTDVMCGATELICDVRLVRFRRLWSTWSICL